VDVASFFHVWRVAVAALIWTSFRRIGSEEWLGVRSRAKLMRDGELMLLDMP
jgi:hypothetical protein